MIRHEHPKLITDKLITITITITVTGQPSLRSCFRGPLAVDTLDAIRWQKGLLPAVSATRLSLAVAEVRNTEYPDARARE